MTREFMNRRTFLACSTAVGIGAVDFRSSATGLQVPLSSQVVEGKKNGMIIHETGIAVLETPLQLLTDQITPLNVLFVRNNQQPDHSATLKPNKLQGWTIEFSGLIKTPQMVDAGLLMGMEQVEQQMVLQCSGNGRALFSKASQTKGTQWLRGGMGNVVVAGVPLAALLDKLGVKVEKSVQFIAAEGAGKPLPSKEDFEHSLPIDDVMNRSILALRINGQPIPAVHGGPVRLMTPGYFGTMHMKWLSRIRFESEETANYNHIPRYRTPRVPIAPGSAVQYTHSNSKPNWRMKVKSVVLSPEAGSVVRAGKSFQVRGVAFNDGSASIDSVLISTDRGTTWTCARLAPSNGPYAWSMWDCQLTLTAGPHEVWARAVDSLGRSQPLEGSVHWNPSGYEWNGVEKIPIRAS